LPVGGDGSRATRGWRAGEDDERYFFSSSSFFFSFFNRPLTVNFSLNQPPTAEIDRRQSILAVPPGGGRSAYRSATGPVRTERYRALPLGKENLAATNC
ncbi:hypothetical protein B296_00038662, partial [Ensete ventricosum]